jgi:hypothetical protein
MITYSDIMVCELSMNKISIFFDILQFCKEIMSLIFWSVSSIWLHLDCSVKAYAIFMQALSVGWSDHIFTYTADRVARRFDGNI